MKTSGLPFDGLTSAEVYTPATEVFNATGPMTERRSIATATLLSNGEVIIIGGEFGMQNGQNSTDLYTP